MVMTELSYLIGTVAIYLALILAQAVFANLRYDLKTLLGPRDDLTPEGMFLLRARRAQANMTEAMVLFIPLVLVAHLADKTSALTAIGAGLFFWARLVYPVVYIAGVPVIRSLVWAAGLVGTLMIFWAVVTPPPAV